MEEAQYFVEMERSEDTLEFIIPYDLERHKQEMSKPEIIYLSIVNEDRLLGFIILAVEPDTKRVEFRRIVVSSKGKGIGQAAIKEMEQFCLKKLGCRRIWLDVFESNKRGRHVYEKLGYNHYKSGSYNGKTLLYYDKRL